ncbi:MAG: tetratricopeptide repeat protein [Hamadaea sp.]|nr:tetratricopeptide repeat protein [Hamadaea sp.]NUT08486.1 tetratricopeptide repeat protein [Hamadaea sp.]
MTTSSEYATAGWGETPRECPALPKAFVATREGAKVTLWPELDLAERYRKAQVFFDAQDYRTAEDLLVEVVTAEPAHQASRLLLARTYYHTAQLRRAEEHLRVIIEREPTEAYAHLMLGRTLQRSGRHAEAVPHLRMAAIMMGEGA